MKRERINRIIISTITWFMALISISPFYIVLTNSFKTQKGIFIDIMGLPFGEYFSPENYIEALEKLNALELVGNPFINSLWLTVISVAVVIIFSSMAAWMLVRVKSKLSTFLFFAFAAAMLIPFQSVMLPLVNLMGKLNLLNPGGLVFMYLGFGSSMAIIMFHGFIKNIPLELEEAAYIDGCNTGRVFFNIVFPLLKPVTVSVIVLDVMWIWNDFLLPQLVINKKEWHTIPLKVYFFFGQFSRKWDLALAALLMAMVPIIIFYLAVQKHIVKGITQGSIK